MASHIHKALASPAGREAVALLRLAFPAAITYLVGFCLQIISIVAVGHVGARELAASALANMYCNATGYAWLYGLCSAVDTLSSQAVGAKNLPRVGHVTQRGLGIMAVALIPVTLLWWNCGLILEHLGQEPETVKLAEVFARLLIPGCPAAMMYEVLKKHLQSCGHMLPPMVIATVAVPINALLAYALVYHTELSFLGK
jgi:MATE family multidrug resistance protein